MGGRGLALPWGAVALALLLVAPAGWSASGSGDLTGGLPVALWGPLDAFAERGGVAASGPALEATLAMVRGTLVLTTLTLVQGPAGPELRPSTEVFEAAGRTLDLLPGDAAQLYARGAAQLSTDGNASLRLPHGPAFAVQHGPSGRVLPYPAGNTLVEAPGAEATVRGLLHVLLAGAPVRLREGPTLVREVDLGFTTMLPVAPGAEVPGLAPSTPQASASLGDAPKLTRTPTVAPEGPRSEEAATPIVDLAASEVQVLQFLEVRGEGMLVVHGARAMVRLFDPAPVVHVRGAAMMPQATGEVRFGGRSVQLQGDAVQIVGDLWLRVAERAPLASKNLYRPLHMQGDFQTFAVNGNLVEVPPGTGAEALIAAVAVAGMASPLLKSGLARVLAPLYARIPSARIMESPVRQRLLALVQREPGVSLSELAARLELSWGATVHHLEVLRRNGLVVSQRHGRCRLWFAIGTHDLERRGQVAVLRNPVSAEVARTVLAQPGLNQKQLAGALGMSPQAVHWHLVRLAEAGLVERQREGREVRHFVQSRPLGPVAAAPTE